MTPGDTGIVHVIMPIGSDPEWRQRQAAIAAGIRKAGLEPRFPQYLPLKPDFSLPDLINDIKSSVAVVADLTGERPSCYYELGVAETMGKGVIAVATEGTAIHQCAVRSDVIFYKDLAELTPLVGAQLPPLAGEGADEWNNVKPAA